MKHKVKNVPNCLSFQIYCPDFLTPGAAYYNLENWFQEKTFKLSKVLSQFDLYFQGIKEK